MPNDEISHIVKLTKTQELVYELKVEDAMRREIVTVSPEDTMDDVRNILREKKISGMPVIKEDELVGMISIEDLIRCLHEGKIKEKVKDKMSAKAVTIYSDEPLVKAVNRFERLGYGRFPVINRQSKKLVGILTKGDIIQCLLKELETSFHEKEINDYTGNGLFEKISADESILRMRYFIQGANFEKAGEQSSKLKKNLFRLGIHPDIVRRVTIASYEAEMNIVVFTPGGELIVTVEFGKITVKASDNGPGIPNVDLAMQPGYSTAPDWVRELGFGAGMGLPNIKNCSDQMNLKSKVGKGTDLQFTVLTRQ